MDLSPKMALTLESSPSLPGMPFLAGPLTDTTVPCERLSRPGPWLEKPFISTGSNGAYLLLCCPVPSSLVGLLGYVVLRVPMSVGKNLFRNVRKVVMEPQMMNRLTSRNLGACQRSSRLGLEAWPWIGSGNSRPDVRRRGNPRNIHGIQE
jgi:hypothetical protein